MNNQEKHLLAELSIADYITLTATFLILIAFWLLWQGKTELAIAIAFVSMFLDYMDGTIARKFGGSPYGKVLDSLYDIQGFVLFPALVANSEANWTWWAVSITTVYGVASALRLARFTAKGYVETNKRYYQGVPVLFSKYALLVVLFWQAKLSILILGIMIPFMISSKLIRKPHPVFAQLNLVYAIFFLILHLQHG